MVRDVAPQNTMRSSRSNPGPSDAIAVAVRTGSPLFVAEDVIREASEVPKG